MYTYTLTTDVYVTTEFIALHRFEGAADRFPEQAYLEHPHRHKFFVKALLTVESNDREVEYHALKDNLDAFIGLWVYGGTWDQSQSCETMAAHILEWLMTAYRDRKHYYVSVAEDNENGSILTAVRDSKVTAHG